MILQAENNNKVKSGLYIISTPIGNLRDITLRALDVLKNSDYILCEDTRTSKILLDRYELKSKLISNHKFNEKKNLSKIIDILKKSDYILCEDTRTSKNLLDRYEIKSKLISNHKFNEKKNLSKIIDILKSDCIVSLISDAGTPSISDPGAILIRECVKNDINIFPISGASAVSTSVSISGFDEKYFFYGFFPEKNNKLKEDFEKLANLNSCIVFFISPRKFNKSIKNIKHYFSGRKILICREMTKFYEEYIRSDIDDLEPFKSDPKGELTIVISEKLKEKKSSIF